MSEQKSFKPVKEKPRQTTQQKWFREYMGVVKLDPEWYTRSAPGFSIRGSYPTKAPASFTPNQELWLAWYSASQKEELQRRDPAYNTLGSFVSSGFYW